RPTTERTTANRTAKPATTPRRPAHDPKPTRSVSTPRRPSWRLEADANAKPKPLDVLRVDRPSDLQIVISAEASEAITNHCQRTGGHVEAGGVLLAIRESPRSLLLIGAGGPGDGRCTRDHYAPDPVVDASYARDVIAQRPDSFLCGWWHMHPRPDSPVEPSADDLQAYASRLERLGLDELLGIIVAPRSDGRASARAWLTSPARNDVGAPLAWFRCVPAALEFSGELAHNWTTV
ncbi:MAG: hypothetical protein ACRDNS_06490, partial [Trebonia sp.]